jgi:6-hydroxytryprostatin B O-methyltransferase
VSHLRRIVGYSMVHRLFYEPEPDHVAHTVFSASLVTDRVLVGELEFLCEDSFQFSNKMVEAHEKWPGSKAASHAAFNASTGSNLPRYAWLSQPGQEKQMKRFANMLEFARLERATNVRFVSQAYRWHEVDTVVDVGGGVGEVGVTLAKAFPHLKVIVEDRSHSVTVGKSMIPPELQTRVELVEHDFFAPRPVEPAAVWSTKTYFLRMVLHNWSDEDAARIVRPLLPAVEAGARLLIMEMMMPPPNTLPEALEWWMRSLDMEMMIEFNSRLRTKEDWARVFEAVHPGLIIKSTTTPPGSGLTVIEIGLK